MKKEIIDYCSRCGEDHGEVIFQEILGNPISADGYDYGYWGWCPTYLEPILLRVDEDEEIADSRTSEEETCKCKDGAVCGCTSEREDTQPSTDEVEPVPTD